MGVYKKNDSPYWYVFLQGSDGKQIHRSTKLRTDKPGTKRLAERLLEKMRVEQFERRHFPARAKRSDGVRLEDLGRIWLKHAEQKRSYKDDAERWRVIEEMLGAKTALIRIDSEDIEDLKRKLLKRPTKRSPKQTLSPATVNRYLALLRSALNYAVKTGRLDRSPMQGVKLIRERNERDRICKPGELTRLIDVAGDELRLAIQLAFYTGMRRGSIASLRWEWIDLDDRIIRLPAEVEKTAKARRVPLPAQAVTALSKWQQGEGDVFDVDADEITRQFRLACKHAKIRDLRFHDLRHTAATNLRRAGVDLFTIAAITGHKTLASLQRYNTVDDCDLLDAVDSLPDDQG